MLMRTTEFYESLPAKRCNTCSETMEEMADCYSNTCTKCQGLTFYPLSPLSASGALPIRSNPLIE
ncbi:YhfH-like protein [Paenibacillus sp. 1_12]|uniref:protein YhfH n=1 Tax=Paenibacillus sp. 1_12 TaxID=1566278 RepID=UPI0008E2DBA3|nr:YhfH-like protein [Paenibacillus sp. 1_12]